MRVCFFLTDFPKLSETFILNQILGVLARGHDVSIDASYACRESKQHPEIARANLLERTHYSMEGIPAEWGPRLVSGLARMATWGPRSPLAVLDSLNVLRYGRQALNLRLLHERLPATAEKQRYDVIHCHFGPNGLRAVALRRLGKLVGPIVTTFHGYDVNALPRRHGVGMYEQLFASTELLTVGSEFMRRRILALGAPAERIVKLRMGVDVRYFYPDTAQPRAETFRVLTVARLVQVKGIEYAIRAIASARTCIPKLRYTIVGDGPLKPSLQALARSLSVDDVVEFEGAFARDEVRERLRQASVVVLPSIVTDGGEEENQPLVLAEAQASGVPVVASNIGGVSESMVDRETGILVPEKDPSAIARALHQLASDPVLRARMAVRGRAFVAEHFDVDRLNDDLVELYSSLQDSGDRARTTPMANGHISSTALALPLGDPR